MSARTAPPARRASILLVEHDRHEGQALYDLLTKAGYDVVRVHHDAAAQAGGTPSSNEVATIRCGERTERAPVAAESEVPSLTPRERDTLTWLANGLTYQQVGVALGISEHTVRSHVRSIYPKLGAACRTEAIRTGMRLGLVTM